MKSFFYFLVFAAVIIGAILFTIMNPAVVEINLMLTTLSLPFSLIVLSSILLGVFLGILIGGMMVLGRKREIRRLRKALANAEKELSNLRKMPLKDVTS